MNPIAQTHVAFLQMIPNTMNMKKTIMAALFNLLCIAGLMHAQTLQEGIKQLENENYAGALNTFQAVLKADPRNTDAYYWIGEVSYVQDNAAEAEKSYRKGLDQNAQCALCYVGVGKVELDKGNTMEAEKNFARAIGVNKKNARSYGHVGDAYLYSKKPDYNKAIEFLRKARDMDPSVATFWAHLGEANDKAGNSGDAMTAYERAVELDPSNSEAYIRMARIWRAAKQPTLAIDLLKKAIEMDPNDARPIKDLYEIYISTREFEKVVPLLEKYVTLIGSDVDAKVRLVKFLTFQAKDYDRAIEEGEKLIKLYPDQYTLHRWLAWAYAGKARQMEETKTTDSIQLVKIRELWQKSYEHSRTLFSEIGKNSERKAFPEDYDYWATGAFKTGLLDTAAHIYRKYIEFQPERANEIYGALAKTYFDSTRYDQAINYYLRKAEGKPLSNVDDYYLALSYYQTEQYELSDSAFARVLAVTPDFATAHLYRARIGIALDPETTQYLAYPHYEKYVELAQADPVTNKRNLLTAYNYLAAYYVHHDDVPKAEALYEEMLKLDPDNEIAKTSLAAIRGR